MVALTTLTCDALVHCPQVLSASRGLGTHVLVEMLGFGGSFATVLVPRRLVGTLWLAALGRISEIADLVKRSIAGDAVQVAPRLPMGHAIIAPDAFSLFDLVGAMLAVP